MILRTLRSLTAGMSMRLAISNEVGSRPNSWTSCRETRISLLTISIMCTETVGAEGAQAGNQYPTTCQVL